MFERLNGEIAAGLNSRRPRAARRAARSFSPSVDGMERRALLSGTTAPEIEVTEPEPDPAAADDIKQAVDFIKENFKGDGLKTKIGEALDDALKNGKIKTGPGRAYDPNTGIITIPKGDIYQTDFGLVHEGTYFYCNRFVAAMVDLLGHEVNLRQANLPGPGPLCLQSPR